MASGTIQYLQSDDQEPRKLLLRGSLRPVCRTAPRHRPASRSAHQRTTGPADLCGPGLRGVDRVGRGPLVRGSGRGGRTRRPAATARACVPHSAGRHSEPARRRGRIAEAAGGSVECAAGERPAGGRVASGRSFSGANRTDSKNCSRCWPPALLDIGCQTPKPRTLSSRALSA